MSDGDNFQEYIDGQRARLESEKAELLQERRLIDERLAYIKSKFRAIGACEAAMRGRTRKPSHNGAAPRARRGGLRETILNTVAASPVGMSRGDILETLGLKGDKSGEGSVSTVLTKLFQAGQVERVDRKYHVPAPALREAAE